MILNGILFCLLFLKISNAVDVYYNFTISYFDGYPDGVVTKILGINEQLPGPTIYASRGDRLIVQVTNQIQDQQGTSIHWHGIMQYLTPFEDGANGVTQCPIPYGKTHTYIIPLNQGGTYWYHAHVNGQYTDGIWGALVIYDNPEYYRNEYDLELHILINDWYHTSHRENAAWYLSTASGGREPIPNSALINGRGSFPCQVAFTENRICYPTYQKPMVFKITRGKRYRIRIINTSAMTSFNFSIDEHSMKIIEADGITTKPVVTNVLNIATAQRYSVIVQMNGQKPSYWLRVGVHTDMFAPGPNKNPNPQALITDVRAVLKYDEPIGYNSNATNQFYYTPYSIGYPNIGMSEFYSTGLTPYNDNDTCPPLYHKEVVLNVNEMVDQNGITRLTFNNIIFNLMGVYTQGAMIPLLVQTLKNQALPQNVNPISISYGQVIQIVLNNNDFRSHPFHMHGHALYAVGVGRQNDGNYDPLKHTLNMLAVKRDTFRVPGRSYIVLRFISSNPGVWLFHCHMSWHVQGGLAATFIEGSDILQQYFSIPQESKNTCAASGIII